MIEVDQNSDYEPRTKLDHQIKDLCEQHGLTFKSWEFPAPWCPVLDRPGPKGDGRWPKGQALRRKLIAEIKRKQSDFKSKV
jgi:hypothetical protein